MTIRLPLLWFSVLILFVALVIQLARWKRAAETEKSLAQVATVHIGTEHQTWLEKVSDAEENQRRLEGQLLWRAPEGLLPELGKISDKLSLSLVGVEELPEWRHGDYGSLPLQLTFSGNYSGFPAFLSVVERIVPAVRIEEVRLYRRKRDKDTLWMSLTLSPTHKTVESDGRKVESEKQKLTTHHSLLATIKMPTIERFSVKRNPFAFDLPAPPSNSARRLKETPLPQLTGILWDDVNPIAIFGARPVGVGEVVAGATILSIQPRRVILMRGGQQHELELWKKSD